MKKIILLFAVILLGLCFKSSGQLNYHFSATKKPYVPVTGGISPHLYTNFGGDLGFWTADDEGFANVPIGFTFNYNGKNLTTANICVNGFVTLGDTIFRGFTAHLWVNSLASGQFTSPTEKPLLAPFWDDLDLIDTLDLVYKTTGQAPFRVFTVEWKKVKWTFESTDPGLSFQVKLYETTNIIEFHYRDEGGIPFAERAFASIGITSSYNNRGFISLQDASANPSISFLRADDSIASKPASNQVYRFIPSFIKPPPYLHTSIAFTDQTVSFDLQSDRFGAHEYAVTRSAIPPASGQTTLLPRVTVRNLLPATTYYVYARSKFLWFFNSQWTCDSFKTAVNPIEPPFHISGDPAVYPYFQPDMRIQDFKDTTIGSYPGSDAVWNAVVDFPNVGDTSLYALNTLFFMDGDSWIFTPGLKLNAGKTYTLKFGYLSYASQAPGPGEISHIEVKYGNATGAAAMNAGTLFKRDDILTPFDEVTGWISFEDTVIEVNPTRSGVYYFGIHNLTTLNNGQGGPVPVVGNFVIAEKTESVLKEQPLTLTGKTINTDNMLELQATPQKGKVTYQVQSSLDGKEFKDIGVANRDKKHSMKYRTVFNDQQKLAKGTSPKNKTMLEPSTSKLDDRFEIQRSEDGKNYTNIRAARSIPGNEIKKERTLLKGKYDFTDRNVEGELYYRIRGVNKNGTTTYSNVIKLGKFDMSGLQITAIYPNPVSDLLNLSVSARAESKMNAMITDMSGRILSRKVIQISKGQNNFGLDVSKLPSGTYLVKMDCGDGCESRVKKFFKQ